MKTLRITLAAGMTAALLASAAYAADANLYNSKAPLIGQRTQVVPPVMVVVAVRELSARSALLSSQPVATTEAPPVELASYNTKALVRGTQPATIELAPLK